MPIEILGSIYKRFLGKVIGFKRRTKNEYSVEQKPLIQLASQMLEVCKQLKEAKLENDKNLLEKRIELIDKQINMQVYAIYGLRREEIKIVEDEAD